MFKKVSVKIIDLKTLIPLKRSSIITRPRKKYFNPLTPIYTTENLEIISEYPIKKWLLENYSPAKNINVMVSKKPLTHKDFYRIITNYDSMFERHDNVEKA